MHKKIIALFVGIGLVIAIAISLLTQQKDTYARMSNQDFLDSAFWATNPNAAAIGNALYDNGTNPTAYTQHWQGGGCVGTPTVVQVSPPTLPSPMNTANTVYVLAPGTYTAPVLVNIEADCVAILGSGNVQFQGLRINIASRNKVIIDNIQINSSVGNGIYVANSSDVTVNNTDIDNTSSNGITLSFSQNIHIRDANIYSNTNNGIEFDQSQDIIVENVSLYDNGEDGAYGYGVDNLQILNYVVYGNANGINLEYTSTSGYLYSGVVNNNRNIGILLDDGPTLITIDQIQAHTNDTYGLAIFGSNTSYNTIQHAQSYYNGSGGIFLVVTSGNALQDVYAYNNVDHGILIHNSTSNTFDDIVVQGNNRGVELNGDSANNIFYNVQSFDNTQQGILVDTANYNYFDYIQVYNNQIGFHIFEGQDNYINNIVGYNNSTAGVDISGKGARRNAFNNAALFNNTYAIYLHTVTSMDEVRDSVFNNAVLFNNNYGLYMNETNNGTVSENDFNNISLYNNDRGVYSNGANVANNRYNGYLEVFGNSLNLFGTNGSDTKLTGALSVPSLGWSAGVLTQSTTFTMTCNWAIQATNTLGLNLLTYPDCNAKGPQVWAGTPDSRYTFFPEIIKQIQPVAYVGLTPVTYGSYVQDMFVGDYVWNGPDYFGGHIVLDESNQFTYDVGGFTYRNTAGSFDIDMVVSTVFNPLGSSVKNYLITGVNDLLYDGVASPIIGVFSTQPINYFNPFYLINVDRLHIVRVGYNDLGHESNYYGFIRGLNTDDDISIQKTVNSGAVIVGNQIGFTITITNSGSADAGFSQVLDPIPAGINTGTLVADPVGVYSGDINTYIWDLPIVSGNTTYTFTITGTVLPGYTGSTIVNTGYFISDYTSNGEDWVISDDESIDVFIPVAGICGTATGNAHYGQNTLNSGVINLCGQGISSGFTGPNINGGYSWMCLGSYGGVSRPCSADENRCGDGGLNSTYEQCDDSNTNDNDGCSNTCQLEYPSCSITASPTYQVGQTTPFMLGWSGFVQPSYLNFGNGTGVAGSGNITMPWTNYTYPAAGVYTATLQVYNSLNIAYSGSCSYQVTITGMCGNAIAEPGEDCDLGSGVNGNGVSGCSTLCAYEDPSCTLSVSPMGGYAPLNVNVVGSLGANSSLVSIAYGDGQTGYALNTNHLYTGIASHSLFMTVQNPIDPSKTAVCSNKVDTIPLTCNDVNFSLAPSTGTVPFPVTGSYAMLPTGYVATGIARGDGNTTANPLVQTNYSNNYINTGFYYSTLLIQNTFDSGFNFSCSLPVGASACGDTGTINVSTLQIDVVKSVQNNGVTVFPNGLVPYIIEVTNSSTQARLDNVTIVDLISDNMSIGSYFFEYNGNTYNGVVNDEYFVIDNTTLPISLNPGETIEIIVYATMDPGQGLQGNNYAFAGGDWVPLNGASFCSSSGSTPTCSRNPNSPAVASVNGRSSYQSLINSVGFNPNSFTVCAETDQGAPTAPGSMGTPSDPSIDIEKTLVDSDGNPTNEVIVREDTTFVLDIDFTNMYPHTINWNNFSLADYFSGGIGISGWHIVDIQTASGVSVPRTTGSNEYNIDLSGLYAPGVYTPACQLFTWTPANHTPGCWTNMPFGSTQANYSSCLPQAAINSGYQYMQRYTVTGAGLNGIQFYPGVNDQWFGGSAVRSLFDTQAHTAMLCQTAPVGIVIDQIDTLQLIVTAVLTEPTLAGEGPVCNEASVSYAGTGDIDDACFDITVPQYCALMIQPDFVIDAYDTVPYISGGYVNGSILSDMTLTSTTTSVNPIVNYQWDISSSGNLFGMNSYASPWTFDNTLIISGQGTPTIDLNFTQYISNSARPFIWVTLTVTDSMGYQAEYTTPLFRDHDNGGLYWVAGNAVTGSVFTGYALNITGEMLSSSTNPGIIPSNQLFRPDSGLVPSVVGIDRENDSFNEAFFSYTAAYNYSNTYTPGVHTFDLNTSIGDTNQNYLLGNRTYPVACSVSCGNGAIEGIEQCDDSNATDSDGCSSSCQVESGRQCVGQPSVCSMNLLCGDGVVQNVTGGTTTGTIDYVIYGDISASTGNEVYGFMGYQSGMLFTFSGNINTGSIVSYQWTLSGSDNMNPGITGFIVGSTTGPSIDIFSNAFGVNGTNRQGHITLTMIDAYGNTIQLQGYINIYRDGMTIVYPSVNDINIVGSTVTYSDYELNIAGSTGLFPPVGFVQNASTGWEILFNNGGWAGYDWYNDGIYDYTQQGTPQVVQYTYNATGEYISTDLTFFYSGFAMNVPADIGDLHANYVFHTTAGQATSGYQEICDDGNQDDYDGCTTQCTLTDPQCQTIILKKIDPMISYQRAYPIWTGSTGMVIQLNTPTTGTNYSYQWTLSGVNMIDTNSLQFSGSSTGTGVDIFVSVDPTTGTYSFPNFVFNVGLIIGDGQITGSVEALVSCNTNGSCAFTTWNYYFNTGNIQGFNINGSYNFVTAMQSINTTTTPVPIGFTGISLTQYAGTYFLGIYDTGTFVSYTSPANGYPYTLNSGSNYDTIYMPGSGGVNATLKLPLSNNVGIQYYNTCTAICGNDIIESNEACDDGNNANGDGCDAQCDFEQRDCSWFSAISSGSTIPKQLSLSIASGIYQGFIFNPINRGDGTYGNIFTDNTHTYNTPGVYNGSIRVRPPAGPNAAPATGQVQCFFAMNMQCGSGSFYCAASQQCVVNGGTCAGCTNGATNYPTCNQCGTGQTYCSTTQQCIASGSACPGCTNGATNYPTCNQCGSGSFYCAASQQCVVNGGTCAGCTNGATNYPTCNQCGSGSFYCAASQQCVVNGGTCAGCTNGATNYPTCDQCGTGQTYCSATQQCIASGSLCGSCANGGINPPTCNICGLGQYYCAASQQCVTSGGACAGCTNGATNYPTCNQCGTGQFYCSASNSCKNNGQSCGGGGGGGGVLTDYCPGGDFSSSYYDRQCGSAPVHSSAPVGKFCIYDDEEYLARGSFDDILGHRGELPIEVMRVSCLHRGRHTKAGLRRYEPNSNIQRDEVLKTLVKIVGVEFEDFTIKSEELLYNGVIPFVDVSNKNRFSHYASYAFAKGLTEGLYTSDTSKKYLSPTKSMTRYEATKAIVIAYEKIHGAIVTQGASGSKITDVPTTDPNYSYVRKAEVAGLVQGYLQKNGTFLFKGNGPITRAEFAKIVAAAFNEQLIDVDEVVTTSSAYNMIIESIQKIKGDKLTFIRNLFEKMKLIDDDLFLKKFKIKKDVFMKVLADKVLLPMVNQ